MSNSSTSNPSELRSNIPEIMVEEYLSKEELMQLVENKINIYTKQFRILSGHATKSEEGFGPEHTKHMEAFRKAIDAANGACEEERQRHGELRISLDDVEAIFRALEIRDEEGAAKR